MSLRPDPWPDPWPKQCPSCQRLYDETHWKGLPYVGLMDDGVVVLELRNCPCRSTIAIRLRPSEVQP